MYHYVFKKLIIMEIVCVFILKHLVYMHVPVNLLKYMCRNAYTIEEEFDLI